MPKTREEYVVQITTPEFGGLPYLFISIEGRRAGPPPQLRLSVGDVLIIERKKRTCCWGRILLEQWLPWLCHCSTEPTQSVTWWLFVGLMGARLWSAC
jgi:hypothetical protein